MIIAVIAYKYVKCNIRARVGSQKQERSIAVQSINGRLAVCGLQLDRGHSLLILYCEDNQIQLVQHTINWHSYDEVANVRYVCNDSTMTSQQGRIKHSLVFDECFPAISHCFTVFNVPERIQCRHFSTGTENKSTSVKFLCTYRITLPLRARRVLLL